MTILREQDLWTFAIELYAKPRVQAACLYLQDRGGLDVPVLLWAGWLANNLIDIDANDVRAADVLIADWRAEIVHPLRAIRRRLRSGLWRVPNDHTEELRDSVKQGELLSEKIELSILELEGRRLISERDAGSGQYNLSVTQRNFNAHPTKEELNSLATIEEAIATG